MKFMTAAALIAASFVAAPAVAAPGSDYQAQAYRDPFYYQQQNQDRGDENPAYTLGCPRGSEIQSWPNGTGRRCVLPGGGYSY